MAPNKALPGTAEEGAGFPRRFLDGLYLQSGRLAAVFLVAICLIVSVQVLGNVVDRLLLLTLDKQLGIVIPGYADIAGLFLSASTFLALAYTLTSGELIRVRLLLGRLPVRWQAPIELWCSGAATIIMGAATWYTLTLVLESKEYGDTLPGMVAIPLYIPQAAMLIGLLILTIAFADAFVSVCRGKQAHYNRPAADDLANLQSN